MHVLLRHSNSRLFYAGLSQWTANTRYARDFGSIPRAERFARARQPATLEIVLRYEAPVCELTLPVPSDTSPSPSAS
jgi:hypothetical protein